MFLAREKDLKLRDEVAPLCRCKKRFTKTRKWVSRSVSRRSFDVAVGTDAWNRPLAREELLAVTTQARLMFRILSHIRKRVITFAHLLPILRRKRVARFAGRAMLLGQM